GVDVNRVEYLSPRHVKVYIQSAAMPEHEQVVQILLARDWYSQPDKQFPEVWALDGLRARDDESGWTIEPNIEQYYADKNVNVIIDRKSTRLNSSHVSISYAVFCLKKKKTTTD